MNVPRWLVPTLAIVAAVAVGASATLLAARFAAPATVHAEPTMIEVPVLAPVAGDVPLEELLAEAGDEIPVSPTVGTEEVVLPGSVPEGAIPEELADLLDDLEAADDPADVLPPAAPPVPADPADPCADSTGALECPDGLAGTILALGGELPPLNVWSTGSNTAACPAADEPGAVRFWARVNAPVTFNLRISQGSPRRQVVETTDEQVERWLEEAGTEEAWIEHCIEITDLIPDVAVFVYLDATDAVGRRATRALTLEVTDGLSIPPTRIHPVGDSTVFVSAAHRPDGVVRTFVLGGDGETEPRCTYDGFPSSFPLVRPARTEEVDAEYLAANEYEPAYTRRTSATFAVPSNTQLVVCVGWFPATETRPTFERNTPLRVSEYRMTSPDVVAPVVTLTELALTEPLGDGGIRLRATTENGQSCGSWAGPPAPPATGALLCDFGALLGRTDAGGSLVLTTEVDTPEGEAVARVLLDVGLLSCVDGCSGRTRSYDVELSKFIRPGRICSDDCRINVGEVAGIARIRVTWPASTAGTGEGWLLGSWREGDASLPRDPSPQLDTSGAFTVSAAGERAFRAAATIRVDRPVTVVADLFTPEMIPGLCPRPGGTERWESTAAASAHTVSFDGLCAGAAFAVTLTLTAADGATSVYSYASPTAETRFWNGAGFSTPTERRPVVVADVRLSTGDPDRVVVLRSMRVSVGGIDARLLVPTTDQRCWIGDIHGLRSGMSAAAAGEAIAVRVSATITDATNPVAATTERFPTRCTDGLFADTERLEFTGYLSYDDFVAGATVTMTDPDTGYSVRVRLTDELGSDG